MSGLKTRYEDSALVRAVSRARRICAAITSIGRRLLSDGAFFEDAGLRAASLIESGRGAMGRTVSAVLPFVVKER